MLPLDVHEFIPEVGRKRLFEHFFHMSDAHRGMVLESALGKPQKFILQIGDLRHAAAPEKGRFDGFALKFC